MLTVTADELTQTAEISFIVSANASASVWSNVRSHPAKIVRSFESQESREVYFSATDRLPADSPLLDASRNSATTVDLSADPDGGVPGAMNPASDYYVHAYADNRHIASSARITTAGYPEQLPAQYNSSTPDISETVDHSPDHPDNRYPMFQFNWGMQMWNRGERTPVTYAVHADSLQRHIIEIRRGEFALYPERFMVPTDSDDSISTVCFQSNHPISVIPYDAKVLSGSGGESFDREVEIANTRMQGNTRIWTPNAGASAPRLSFHNAPAIPTNKHEEVDDLMISLGVLIDRLLSESDVEQKFRQSGLILIVDRTPACVNAAYVYGLKDKMYGVIRVVDR